MFDLARHDIIEVDGSLTRNDIYFGDDVHFDASVFAPVAKDLGLDQNRRGDRYVTVKAAAKATKNRLTLAKSVNPAFNASAFEQLTEYGNTALFLLTLWDEQKQASPKSWVGALLGKNLIEYKVCTQLDTDLLPAEERIPYREGYSRALSVKTLEQLGNLTLALRALAGRNPRTMRT